MQQVRINPKHSHRLDLPPRSSHPTKSLLQSAPSTIPTYESAVYIATETFLRLNTSSLQIILDPSKLQFTLSSPTPVPFNPHQPLSPLHSLTVLSNLSLTSPITPDSPPTSPPSPPHHVTLLSVHNLFYTLPTRRRIESARHPIQIQTTARHILVALSLANPHVSFSVFGPHSQPVYLSPSSSLSIAKIQSAFGITHSLYWRPVVAHFLTAGFIARHGADTSSICLISVNGIPLLDNGWAHNLVNRTWKSYHVKTSRKPGPRFPAYVLNFNATEACCLSEGASPSIELERGLIQAVRHALKGFGTEEKGVVSAPLLPRKRRPVSNRFSEAIVTNKMRRVSKWERAGSLSAKRQILRPISEPCSINRSFSECKRLCIGRPKSVEGVEGTYRRHVPGWKNPCFPGRARATNSSKGSGRFGNGREVADAGKQMASMSKDSLLHLRVMAQIDRKFILAVDRETVLYAVDQHAVSERYLYERFMKSASLGKIVSMTLSHPKAISLTNQHRSTASRHAATLEQWGWRLALCAQDVRMIGVPLLRKLKIVLDEAGQLFEYLEQLHRGTSRIVTPRPIVDVVARTACHTAVRFGDDLTKEKCQSLLSALHDCNSPFICAHGRPSFVPLAVLKPRVATKQPRTEG